MIKRKVLIPLDRTEYSAKIITQAMKFIDPTDTKIFLLHVAEPASGIGLGSTEYDLSRWDPDQVTAHLRNRMPHPIYADQVEMTLASEIEGELMKQVKPLKQAGYAVSVKVEFGDPVTEILDFIRREKIDLIAMTTHAREGIKRLLFGSVAEKIVHKVNIPTLLLHPEERASLEGLRQEPVSA